MGEIKKKYSNVIGPPGEINHSGIDTKPKSRTCRGRTRRRKQKKPQKKKKKMDAVDTCPDRALRLTFQSTSCVSCQFFFGFVLFWVISLPVFLMNGNVSSWRNHVNRSKQSKPVPNHWRVHVENEALRLAHELPFLDRYSFYLILLLFVLVLFYFELCSFGCLSSKSRLG